MRQPRRADNIISDSPRKRKIAIVDDEKLLTSLYSIMFQRLGYDVFSANAGEEIVEAISNKAFSPDLIVMDYRMPGMDGMTAAKIILTKKPDMKILIASSHVAVEAEVVGAGMRFLKKPFSMTQIERAVEEYLGET